MRISFLVLFYGAVRRSPMVAKFGGAAAFTIAAAYLILLAGVRSPAAKRSCQQ